MFRQCVLGIVLGFLTSLWCLQHDLHIQARIGTIVLRALQKNLSCTLSGTVSHFSLFGPCLVFDNVYAAANNNHWSWHAQRLTIACSWFDIIVHRMLMLYIDAEQCRADSQVIGNHLGIWEFIDTLRKTAPVGVPITLKSLDVHNAYVNIYDEARRAKATLMLNCMLKKMGKKFKVVVESHDLSVLLKRKQELHDGHGVVTIQTDAQLNEMVTTYSLDYAYKLSAYPESVCTASGLWDGVRGSVSTKSADDVWSVAATATKKNASTMVAQLHTKFPVHLVARVAKQSALAPLNGLCLLDMTLEKNGSAYSAHGIVTCNNLSYQQTPVMNKIQSTIDVTGKSVTGQLVCAQKELASVQGSWCFDAQAGSLQAILRNESNDLTVNYKELSLIPQQLKISVDAHKKIQASYEFQLHDERYKKIYPLSGQVEVRNGSVQLAGSCGLLRYGLEALYSPALVLQSCYVKDDERTYATINAVGSKPHMRACIDLSCAKYLLGDGFLSGVQMDGMLQVQGFMVQNRLYGSLMLHDGAVRYTSMHNVLKEIQARFVVDIARRSLIVRDVHCGLHRGAITCKRAAFWFNDRMELASVHVPLSIKDCFIHHARDFFGTLSGFCLYSYQRDKKSHLYADLTLDKAHLKYNIFATSFSHQLFSPSKRSVGSALDVDLNLAVRTKNPLRVKTLFLQTDVKIAMNVIGSYAKPSVVGSLELLSGELLFPYKPLYITKGAIHFSANSFDPTIHLVAKNTIKQHYVTLQISGSLKDPHVFLDASPQLTEEQIIGLLLVGAQQDSLSFIVPAVIANNLKNLIFSADQSFPVLEQYMHRFLKPLRYINVMPSLADQSGRGGFRGAVEIEISEQLRAYMQKNFSRSEDTRFELEYIFSDDVRLKGIRDERGDCGAEVEMRWKF